MTSIDVEKENIKKPTKDSGKIQKPVLVDQIGSREYYEDEKITEDITLPGEKKAIRAETVSKEEIYQDKLEKQQAFIAGLGRKKEAEEKSGNGQPEYVEEKRSPGQKIIYSLLSVIVLGAMISGGYWFWSDKKQKVTPGEDPSRIAIPISQEPSQDNSDGEQPGSENDQAKEIKPSEIDLKVLNVGAPTGSAGRVKDFLVSQEYTKTVAGNGQKTDTAKSYIFYKEEKFKEQAQTISNLLLKKKKISAEIKAAISEEEKSADIVVELGKT